MLRQLVWGELYALTFLKAAWSDFHYGQVWGPEIVLIFCVNDDFGHFKLCNHLSNSFGFVSYSGVIYLKKFASAFTVFVFLFFFMLLFIGKNFWAYIN